MKKDSVDVRNAARHFRDAETPRYWTPLRELSHDDFHPPRPELIATTMQHHNIDEAAARKMLDDELRKSRVFINDLYQVAVTPCGDDGDWLQINIRRTDGGMFKDWRHFQQIKNEVAGPEREAVEIYPAESRKVDQCNKWHLWVLPEDARVPIGWQERDVSYEENRKVPGMRQRPL